jgi:hypothetical protein
MTTAGKGFFPVRQLRPNKAGLITGSFINTINGVPVRLPAQAFDDGYPPTIVASPANIGNVAITFEDTTNPLLQFYGLMPGLAVELPITNLSLVWIMVENDGDAVSWIAAKS